MKAKHTQGEWQIEKSELVHDLLIIGDCKLIGRVQPEDSTDEEFEANAKLMAASPELLQALIMIVNDTEFTNGQILQSTLNRVKEAIKKATI